MADDLRALRARQRAAAIRVIEVWMDGVLGEAQRLAPLEEGTLRGSADRHTEDDGRTVRVIGSFNTVYAARQHEELGWHHPHGQAKYLEQPFKARLPQLAPAIAAAVRAVS